MRDAERVHLIGLVSDGGVHSSDRHLKALIELAAEWDVPDLVIHAFTDGRDTLPTSGAGFVAQVEEWCRDAGSGRVGSVVGRYFAMDRDKRWDRIQKAYDLLVHGKAEHHADTGEAAVRAAYERDETDEFITPTTVGDEACIRPGDSVIGFNFRPDRMREITLALADPDFDEIDRGGAGPIERYATMTRVRGGLGLPGALPAAPAGDHDRPGHRRPRAQAAARRRDREVPARHVLLQRRRGGPVPGRGARARARRRATSRPTTTSPR